MAAPLEPIQKALDDTDADMRAASGKVSDVCRNIGVGSLAIFYALLLADQNPAAVFYNNFKWELTFLALLGAATFLVDYLQYLFNYIHLQRRLNIFRVKALKKELNVKAINESQESRWKYISKFAFFLKNIFALSCCILLVYIITRRVLAF